jgi:hypothetical protein
MLDAFRSMSPHDILQKHFGFPTFRGPQLEIIEHVLQGQHALVIDNWNSMIEAIAECRATPAKAQALAREGRKLAESMDWKTIAEKYNSLYATLP